MVTNPRRRSRRTRQSPSHSPSTRLRSHHPRTREFLPIGLHFGARGRMERVENGRVETSVEGVLLTDGRTVDES